MIFAASLYALRLTLYTKFAWQGFLEFLQKAIEGQIIERVFPWNRITTLCTEDVAVASLGYLSLMLVSLITAVISTIVLMKRDPTRETENRNMLFSVSICLWLAIVAGGVGFIGASTMPETSFSDIRTISVVFVSMLVPLPFMSRPFTSKIIRSKLLPALLIILIALASVRTMYEVFPKSIHDPVNTLEDVRHTFSGETYAAGKYIKTYYKSGGIIGDFSALNPTIEPMLPESQYARARLSEKNVGEAFSRFPSRTILVLSFGGTERPSQYHSHEAYVLAFRFAAVHNRVYDNGGVMITLWGI
jgi:hypothetical protein